MATRPLDAAFGGSTTKKSKKRGAILAVGIVAGLASIGSIFAASVSINNNADPGISYSQATTTIAACDENIVASIGAYYDTTEGAFSADQITLSDVSDSCDSQTLTLELYNGSTKLVTFVGDIASGAGTTELVIGSADSILTGGVGGAMTGTTTGFSGTPTIVYAGANDSYDVASNATRIVIEIN